MNRKRLLVTLLLIGALGGGAWFAPWSAGSKQAEAQAKGQPEADVSALVKSAPIQHKTLASLLTVFGEVNTGKIEAISFPRAGRVSALLIVQGQRVTRGTPLATLAGDPNTQLAYEQAVGARNLAQGELKRNEELFALQLATQSQVDNARKALVDAQANLNAQRKLGGGEGSTTINAPFDGVVIAISVAQGDRIQPGAPILQLGHTNSLRVQLGIEPDDGHLVKVGLPVELALLHNPKETLQGTISELQDLVDQKTQLINAVVVLPVKPAGPLVPGMRVRATINVGERMAWVVPREAVLTDDNGSFVFQISGSTAHRVNVKKLQENRDIVGIDGPIDPEASIVVLGNYELRDGMKVREGGA
jgi:membrane fusion protein, multidrug efflux system